jgi:hypothetical protein
MAGLLPFMRKTGKRLQRRMKAAASMKGRFGFLVFGKH